ncbi:unnamed protein product [Polarella glacialis]|uniref:Reverse transcriptase domain-containing protein n=1 Tax=Polarella glacialis TaxID=89957 RepID=A0A813HG44_POLGL|nr:unnamed protein product [Polarella glacialis]
MMRNLANQHFLHFVKTWNEGRSGPTWFGPTTAQSCSRIDYVLLPKAFSSSVQSCRVWYRSGYRLQLANTYRQIDHSPVVITFKYRSWFLPKRTTTLTDRAAILRDYRSGRTQPFQECLQRQLEQISIQGEQSEQVDVQWNKIKNAVQAAAETCYPLRGPLFSYQRSAETKEKWAELQHFRATVRKWNFGDLPYSAFYHWYVAVRLVRLKRAVAQSTKHDWRLYTERLLELLHTAEAEHDHRTMWQIARVLAKTHVGPKRRVYSLTSHTFPTLAEWQAHLAQEGPAGGCEATLIASDFQQPLPVQSLSLDLAETYSRDSLPICFSASGAEQDVEILKHQLGQARSYRAVPRWSASREAWLLALSDSNSNCYQQLQQMFNTTRRVHLSPQLWCVSQTAQIPKNNGKCGCKALRLVHLLDPAGKAWHRGLWKRAEHPRSLRQTGFTPHRRREQAIQQVRCLLWRLSAAKVSWCFVKWDIANAFPSPKHDVLDSVIEEDCCKTDVPFLTQRHRRACMVVSVGTGDLLCQIGCGDLQGDTCAPVKFIRVYDPIVASWMSMTEPEKQQSLKFHNPVTNKWFDCSCIIAADDLVRIGIVSDLSQLSNIFRTWDSTFDRKLDRVGMAQNKMKKTLLYHPSGKGALAQTRKAQRRDADCSDLQLQK